MPTIFRAERLYECNGLIADLASIEPNSLLTLSFSIFQLVREKKLNHDRITLNSRGYCQTRIDQDTKIHMDVSICIVPNDIVATNVSNPYEILDRMEHIGE